MVNFFQKNSFFIYCAVEFTVYRNLTGVSNAGNLTQKKAAMDMLVDTEIEIKVGVWQKKYNWYGYQQPSQ